MANVVFILGAGASREGGCPVVREFFETAERLASNPRCAHIQAPWDAVQKLRGAFGRVGGKAVLDLGSFEEVFSALAMAESLGGFGDWKLGHLRRARNEFVRLVAGVLEETQQFQIVTEPGSKSRRVVGPSGYAELARMIRTYRTGPIRHNISIVNFNYDCGMELALRAEKLFIDYSLSGNMATSERIPVLKPHGSLNWFLNSDDKIEWVSPTPPKPAANDTSSTTTVRFARPSTHEGGGPSVSTRPFIVPPQVEKSGFWQPIQSVVRRIANVLSNADVICVIGFSLPPTDVYFRYLLAVALNSDRLLDRFAVIDPSPAIIEKYRGFVGPQVRFHGIPKPFSVGLPEFERWVTA